MGKKGEGFLEDFVKEVKPLTQYDVSSLPTR